MYDTVMVFILVEVAMKEARSLIQSLAVAVRQTRQHIMVVREQSDAFTMLPTPPHKGTTSSPTYRIDIEAEAFLHQTLRSVVGDPAFVCIGEEQPVPAEARAHATHCAVTDALDGSTLLKVGSDHWAVVVALVDLIERNVLAAAVADGAGHVLVAHRDLTGIYLDGVTPFTARLSTHPALGGCTLAFSGLTPKKMRLGIQRLGERLDDVRFVIPIGGHPAMVHVLYGEIDCVFGNSRGHDFVATAFIAEKSGACVRTWRGEQIAYGEVLLAGQAVRHQWVVAANETLGADLCTALTAQES